MFYLNSEKQNWVWSLFNPDFSIEEVIRFEPLLFSSVIEEADDFAIKPFSPVRLCREKDSIAKFRFNGIGIIGKFVSGLFIFSGFVMAGFTGK